MSRAPNMTVCMLLQNFYEIDIRVRRKAEALVAAGYSVDVLALRSDGDASDSYTLEGVRVFTFALSKQRGSKIRYLFEYLSFLLWTFIRLSRLMEQRHYAVVDVNNLPDFLVFAAVYARWRGAKVVFDMHEITPEFIRSKYGVPETHWQVRVATWVEKACMRFADHVMTINEPIQRLLEGRGLKAGASTILMNAVDESLFAAAAATAPPPVPGLPTDRFVMMYHGTLTRMYGLDLAIEALGLVAAEMPDAELWILGGGPERQALQEQAARLQLGGKVRFIGSVRPEEIPHWLARCEVGVLATRRDVFLDLSFSNKLSEYIIMNRAVISSGLKSIRHYFTDEALAFFEPNNPRELSRQMLRLYADRELRARLAARAKQEYAPIRWEIMKQRYLETMGRLVRPPQASAQVVAGLT